MENEHHHPPVVMITRDELEEYLQMLKGKGDKNVWFPVKEVVLPGILSVDNDREAYIA